MKSEKDDSDEMKEEYDFSGGVRGKYAERYAKGHNVVLLDPDVARLFRDSESVNDALRALVELAGKQSDKLEDWIADLVTRSQNSQKD